METIFQLWHKLKSKLQRRSFIRDFHEREIFWLHFGKNLGFEIDGKSENFSRPILILKKLSRETFVGLPLTTRKKSGNYFFQFDFLGKKSTAIFAQIRVFDQRRLYEKMGKISAADFRKLKEKIKEFFD